MNRSAVCHRIQELFQVEIHDDGEARADMLLRAPPPDGPSVRAGTRSSHPRRSGPSPPAGPAASPAGGSGRAPSGCRAAVSRPTPSGSRPAAPAGACRFRRAAGPGSRASGPSGRRPGRRRSSRRSPARPCCAVPVSAPSSGCRVRPPAPCAAHTRPPGVRARLAPPRLRTLRARRLGLHPSPPPRRPAPAGFSAAWSSRARRPTCPLHRSGLRPAFCRLLCPLLTSAPRSRASRPAQSGIPDATQISRGKTDHLRRTPAGFTTPALDDRGLRDSVLARPAG